MAEEESTAPHTRVFINNVDTYTSKYIAKYLNSCAVGASLESIVDEDEEKSQEQTSTIAKSTFTIVGTSSCKKDEKSTFITEQYDSLTREELFPHLMDSDVIIYNITEHLDQVEEASWAVSALYKEMNSFPGPKMFILISTVMTWALSKPADPKLCFYTVGQKMSSVLFPRDPEIPLTKDDYLRRKAHPNFKDHITLEKLVAKLGKTNRSQFGTYIVASGIQYGMGEGVFHYFFQKSWLGKIPKVPVFGDGSNTIPTIHITDLAKIIQNVIDHKPTLQYFLAVDDSKNTSNDIIWTIAFALGPGKIQNLPKEHIYLTKELTQAEIDYLFVNLRMEANFQKDNFNIRWVAQNGITQHIDNVLNEYRVVRGLQPVRICILGPPAVGKSTIAEKICKHYKLQHVKLKEAIAETFARLETRVLLKTEENDVDEAPNQDFDFLEVLKENMEQNKGRLDEQHIIQIVKEKLYSKPCQNQGFVLDGFPKTYEQAKKLFSAEAGKSEDTRTSASQQNTKITPEFVFFLDASDDVLKDRVLNLPGSVLEWTAKSFNDYQSSLAKFRLNNAEEETVLNFFDEIEIHHEHIDITSDDDEDYTLVIEKVKKMVGEVRDYGCSAEELEQEERRRAEAELKECQAEQAEAQRREDEELALRDKRWDEWSQRLEVERNLEEELLAAETADMRSYMMQQVTPVLMQGLIECCRLRPDDPIDFLAEYLLKNNPDGKK